MIVLAIAGILFARMGYLKQQANYHRSEANRLASLLAAKENASPSKIEKDLAFIVSGGEAPIVWHREDPSQISVLNGKKGRGARPDTADDLQAACVHLVLADRFERAVFRPWMLVNTSTARKEPPPP